MEDEFSSDSSDDGFESNSDSDMVFSSDDEEPNEVDEGNNVHGQDILWPIIGRLLHGRQRQRVENYVHVVQNKSDDEFRCMFRVTRQVFLQLLEKLENSGRIPTHPGGRPKKSAEVCLLMTLHYLSKKTGQSDEAELFDMSQSSVHRIVARVLQWMVSLSREVIVWPSGAKAREVAEAFEAIAGISGCIGAIDGSHIPIQKPHIDGDDYYNRKYGFSILLQAVVDADMKFTNCYAGDPGRMHDTRCLRRSLLYARAERDVNRVFPHGTFLLGDKGYIGYGHRWIVTPFKDNQIVDPDQTDFNRRVSKTRVKVECAFGILKARFRKLKMVEARDMDIIVRMVLACCVLHNLCITNGDFGDNLEDEDDDDGHNSDGDETDSSDDENVIPAANIPNGDVRQMQLFHDMYPHFDLNRIQ